MKPIEKVLFTVVLAGAQLWAQAIPEGPLHEAYVFEKQGQFDKAAGIAKELVDSGRLSGVELGRAWNVLGVVYTQQGKLMEAQNAFERSLQIFGQEPQFVTDYAAALQNYGELYNDSGERAVAGKMWRKALDLLQRSGDHAGIARSLTYLAGLALAQNQVASARKYLQSVAEEMKLTHDLSDDDLAFIYETQAWLARAEGHFSAAVAGYQRSLELCKRIYGEGHWKTGWDYMLRGKAYAHVWGHREGVRRHAGRAWHHGEGVGTQESQIFCGADCLCRGSGSSWIEGTGGAMAGGSRAGSERFLSEPMCRLYD